MRYTFFFLLLSFCLHLSVFSQNTFHLKYNFNTGDSYLVKTKTISDSEQKINGKSMKIIDEYFLNYYFNIISKKDTAFLTEIKFKNIITKINHDNFSLLFHSDSVNNEVSEQYHSFLSKKLKFSLSSSGILFQKDSLNSLFPDSADYQAKKLFNTAVNRKINELLPVQIHFPPKSIQLKESWTVNDTISTGMFYVFDKNYTLDSVKNSKIYLSEKAKIFSDKNKPVKTEKVYISYDVSGTNTGNFILDKKSGIITEGKIIQKIKGTANLHYTKTGEAAYTWPINFTNTIYVKTEKISNKTNSNEQN